MRKHLLILALYTALALVLTWPLALRFNTHVIGDGSDDPALAWNLWWFKHAVLDLQTSPLTTDYMFYPIGINLVFYTLTLLNDAISLPLQAIFGLVPAANVLLLSSFVLSGYGTFLFLMYLMCDWKTKIGSWELEVRSWKLEVLCPFIAGLVYAFSSNKMLYASLGQFNIASSQWIPFYVLYLFKLRCALHTPRSTRIALLAAFFLLLQAYAEFTFASFLIVFTFCFALAQLRPLKQFWPLARALTLIAVVFAMGFAPILVPLVQAMRLEGDFLAQGSGFAEAFSADVVGFFVPSKLNPLLGWLDGRFDFPYVNFMFVGWLTLALALVGAWRYRRHFVARFWSATTLVFVILSLGPSLRINGYEFAIPLPFSLFQWLPFFKGNRYPSRYSVMITLGVAVLVGFGLRYLLSKQGMLSRQGTAPLGEISGDKGGARHRTWISPSFLLFSVIGLLILLEHGSVLPLSDFRVPSFYEAIRDEAGDFTVLELPLAWRNGFRVTGALEDTAGKAFMRAQWYQTVHQKKMLSGNTSRNPELKFQYFTEAPFINSLIALETGHPLDDVARAQDKQFAREVLRFFNVRYIVLRPEAGDKVRPYLESLLSDLTLWREENGVRVYRLPPNPSPATNSASQERGVTVEPKSPLARVYFAEGWGELGEQRAWAQRNETRLLLPMQNADNVMTLRLTIPDEGQKLTVVVNGQPIGTTTLMSGMHEYRLPIAKPWVREGVNEVVLRWKQLYEVKSLNDFGVRAPHNHFVVAKSAGEEVGDFAHIWIDGVDWSLNQRGYNFVTFDPGISSTDPTSYYFDTFDSPQQSAMLAHQLQYEDGGSFAIAIRDEASRNLNQDLVQALGKQGAHAKIGWRWSHALIRYSHTLVTNGNSSNELFVVEDASPIRPAIVSIGERITTPQVTGAVEWIQVQPSDGAQ